MSALRQVVHILLKDVRGHAPEIGLVLILNLVLTLTLAQTWSEDGPYFREDLIDVAAQLLLVVACCVLIGRVVQVDGVAGKAPYSLTRPCSRPALLASKLAFVLLFVHLPIFLSQLAIVTASGVPLSLLQLLVNQVLFVAGISLPLMAVAALTTTFSRFVFCGVVVAAVGTLTYGAALYNSTTPLFAASLTMLALIASVALTVQYRWRSTLPVAAWSSACLLLLGLVLVAPWTIRMIEASERDARYPPPVVSFPIDTGLADDAYLRRYDIEVQTPEGRDVDLGVWGARMGRTGESYDSLELQLSPTDYETLKDSLVSVRLVADIETYESRAMEPIPLDGSFAIVGGRAQCGLSNPFAIVCRTSFGRSVWRLNESNTEARLRWLPVRLRFVLNPIQSMLIGTRPDNPFAGASIATALREPVSYTTQDVTFENIRLSDWTLEQPEATP